jgi:hypothetical protein
MCGLIEEMGFEHKTEEWWLLIVISEVSLEVVLLITGTKNLHFL